MALTIKNCTAINCGALAELDGVKHLIAEDNVSVGSPTMFKLKKVGLVELRRNHHVKDPAAGGGTSA
jgi:hypothetical protein